MCDRCEVKMVVDSINVEFSLNALSLKIINFIEEKQKSNSSFTLKEAYDYCLRNINAYYEPIILDRIKYYLDKDLVKDSAKAKEIEGINFYLNKSMAKLKKGENSYG